MSRCGESAKAPSVSASVQTSRAERAGPVRGRYEAMVKHGAIERDHAQEILADRFDRLVRELEAIRTDEGGLFGRLFGSRKPAPSIKGLYVWGLVGRGKTMLMDIFYEEVDIARKRRAHFNAFMADAHERIHAFRQAVKQGTRKDTDPIPHVAADLAAEATLLCFDEFTVTDIADAMILGRLFKAMFERGVTVVATSNVEPDRLYENGLNRPLFVPFIGLIEQHMEVVRLDSRTDFRLEKLGGSPVYLVPPDAAARAALDRAFRQLSGLPHGKPRTLIIKGHALEIPEAGSGVARFGFAGICGKAYGASDYMALAREFHTVIIDDIPILDLDRRNEAKRLIILIDTLYDYRVKLLASAEAEPTALYVGTSGREAFEFERTASRLIEMRSDDYLAAPHGQAVDAAVPERGGDRIAET